MKTAYFDMDGTIADFYGVENWLDYLANYDDDAIISVDDINLSLSEFFEKHPNTLEAIRRALLDWLEMSRDELVVSAIDANAVSCDIKFVAVLPLLAVILMAMAIGRIKADMKLLSDSDRLR